jgi:GT2 family glycosyltransferase
MLKGLRYAVCGRPSAVCYNSPLVNANSSQPAVAAVVVNWNGAALTVACVESLLASRYANLRVLVVDNGSTDGSADEIAAHVPAAELVRSAHNRGFAGGCNVGIRAALEAGAEYVLLANNDAFVAPDMLPELVATLEADAARGVAGPLICYASDPELVWYLADDERRWLPVPRRVGSDEPASSIAPDARRVGYVCGCGMLVRRAVFERAGLLDERFYMYFEDADFCRRARAAGFAIWAAPRARMWHHVSRSAQRVAAASRERITMYRILFYRRHTTGLKRAAAAAFVAYAALRAVWGDLRHGRRELLAPTLRGFVQGWTMKD